MKIGTHSGAFHADEALAVWMLRQLPKFKNAAVVRSRNPELLNQCDIVVDVSGKYEPPKFYDHHQREFTTTFDEKHTCTKLSSAGLVYKHFGKEVLATIVGPALDNLKINNKRVKIDVENIVNDIYVRLYEDFVEAVDAMDNGVTAYTETPKYKLKAMSLQSLVSNLNPSPFEEAADERYDQQFQKASDLMGMAFANEVTNAQMGWYFSKTAVQRAYDERFKYDKNGHIMVLESACNWKNPLSEIEAGKTDQLVLYVLYPTGDSCRVQAVSVTPDSFESRKPLPKEWRGLRDEELSAKSGIPNCVFVHASGFIGGNKTQEGAIEMAQKALTFE